MLPDDILVEIFNFYADEAMAEAICEDENGDIGSVKKRIIEGWITLAHVCRRWRNVIF